MQTLFFKHFLIYIVVSPFHELMSSLAYHNTSLSNIFLDIEALSKEKNGR